jgi:Tol biopolymer transport system component
VLSIPPGTHIVELADVAANCSGGNPRVVSVGQGGRTSVTFEMDCPNFGAIDVIVTTSGPSHDPDGYLLSVDGVVLDTLALQDQAHLGDIRPSVHSLRLSSVEGNCAVDGGSSRFVTLEEGGVITVNFSVTCVPRTDDTPGEKLVIASSDALSTSTLYLMEPDGSGRQRLIDEPGDALSPEFSQDGERILFIKVLGVTRTLTILDRASRRETMLPTLGVDRAVWSPDGATILFVRSGRLFRMKSDGTGESAVTNGSNESDPYWSPDGTQIAFTRDNAVYLVNASGSPVIHQLTTDPHTAGPWSPDGRYLVMTKLQENVDCYYYYDSCGFSPVGLVILDVQTGAERSLTLSPYQSVWSPAWATDGQSVYFISAPTGNPDVYQVGLAGSPLVNRTASAARETCVTVGSVGASGSALRSGKLRRP